MQKNAESANECLINITLVLSYNGN